MSGITESSSGVLDVVRGVLVEAGLEGVGDGEIDGLAFDLEGEEHHLSHQHPQPEEKGPYASNEQVGEPNRTWKRSNYKDVVKSQRHAPSRETDPLTPLQQPGGRWDS